MEPSCLALCPLASSLALHCDVAHSQLSRSDSSTTAKINNSRKPKTFCGNPDHRQLFHMWVFHPGKHQDAGGFPTVMELSPRGCPRQLRQ
ncbi:hypothetical protein PR003_g22688 [Phytophthora rubi]|uniref:Uncharacterized protein n=1 Tax=Phytophthora rubi TaxID=129364 RepID=A0A6A3MXS3_9STRA|nr:hypothetical protein PR002_g8597 [Phytophthora rubi]KAE9300734.1 hypothetical protein PR003_g22688 [Phytophthora rubi]